MAAVRRWGPVIGLACAALLGLAAAAPAGGAVTAVVGGPSSAPAIAPGFLGFSMEFYAVHEYAGTNPAQINPVLVQLIGNLNPGQAPVLRIGGDSTDQSWWPVPGVLPPRGIDYPLTRGWIRIVSALAQSLGAKLIVGVNLMLDRPALAAVEARALRSGLGSSLEAFELGNEADLYGTLPWYSTPAGKQVFARPRSYDVGAFLRDSAAVESALPATPLAGPAFSGPGWMSTGLASYIAATRRLAVVTMHRYPLRGCNTPPSSPMYPTIANLLSDNAQSGLAASVAPYVAMAHADGMPFRVDELNSVACSGVAGVSDTFASGLWMLDTLFEMANVGVDGVNVHTLAAAKYAPFSFTDGPGGWQASVQPDYYGMLMFAQAAPPGARLLSVGGVPDGPVHVWATLAPDGTERVLIINEDVANQQQVLVQAPGNSAAAEWLSAPGADATTGVTLGGQTFGTETSTGALPGPPATSTVYPFLGIYPVTLPPASAVMLTLQ